MTAWGQAILPGLGGTGGPFDWWYFCELVWRGEYISESPSISKIYCWLLISLPPPSPGDIVKTKREWGGEGVIRETAYCSGMWAAHTASSLWSESKKKIVLVQNSIRGKGKINSFPQRAATTFAFSSVIFSVLCSECWNLVFEYLSRNRTKFETICTENF